MPNFAQCHRCKLTLPVHYFTIIMAKGKSSGKKMRVRVCHSCCDAIVKEQQA